MSELDRLKEQVAYLKFWQGIMVVTDISLVGWLVSTADGARPLTVALAIVGVVLLTLGIVMLAVVIVFVGIALDAARRAK